MAQWRLPSELCQVTQGFGQSCFENLQCGDSTSFLGSCSCAEPFSWSSNSSLYLVTIPVAAASDLPLALSLCISEKNLAPSSLQMQQSMVVWQVRAVRLHGSLKILSSGFNPEIQHTCRALVQLPRAARGIVAAAGSYSGPCSCRELRWDPSLHSQEGRGAQTAACMKSLEKSYQSLCLQSLTSTNWNFFLTETPHLFFSCFLANLTFRLILWRPEVFSLTSVKPSLLEGSGTETTGHAHHGAWQQLSITAGTSTLQAGEPSQPCTETAGPSPPHLVLCAAKSTLACWVWSSSPFLLIAPTSLHPLLCLPAPLPPLESLPPPPLVTPPQLPPTHAVGDPPRGLSEFIHQQNPCARWAGDQANAIRRSLDGTKRWPCSRWALQPLYWLPWENGEGLQPWSLCASPDFAGW